ncbi:MAG: ribonuclease P protein component 4 [Candidatus Asgardarchaeia archaeon]
MKRYVMRDIAIQRIGILLSKARETIKDDAELSKRYVYLARKIAMKARVRIPRKWKIWICKKCNTYLLPGYNARVRIRENRMSHLIITCLNCGNQKRYYLKNRIKNKV